MITLDYKKPNTFVEYVADCSRSTASEVLAAVRKQADKAPRVGELPTVRDLVDTVDEHQFVVLFNRKDEYSRPVWGDLTNIWFHFKGNFKRGTWGVYSPDKNYIFFPFKDYGKSWIVLDAKKAGHVDNSMYCKKIRKLLGWEEEKKREIRRYYIENQDHKTAVKCHETLHFVYAHGILEDLADYDIVVVPTKKDCDLSERVEKCIAVLPDGREVNATLYNWIYRIGADHYVYSHGLLVASDDKEAIEHARKAYKEKRSFV